MEVVRKGDNGPENSYRYEIHLIDKERAEIAKRLVKLNLRLKKVQIVNFNVRINEPAREAVAFKRKWYQIWKPNREVFAGDEIKSQEIVHNKTITEPKPINPKPDNGIGP